MVFLFERCAIRPYLRSDLNYNIATDLDMAENCPATPAAKHRVAVVGGFVLSRAAGHGTFAETAHRPSGVFRAWAWYVMAVCGIARDTC